MQITKRCNPQRGATLLEAAIAFPLLFFIVFGAIDLTVAAFRGVTLQYSVASAGRWATLGEVLEDPNHLGQYLSREASIVEQIKRYAQRYNLDLTGATFDICPIDSICTSGSQNAGGPGSTIGIKVTRPTNLLFKSVTLNLNGFVIARNEPYA